MLVSANSAALAVQITELKAKAERNMQKGAAQKIRFIPKSEEDIDRNLEKNKKKFILITNYGELSHLSEKYRTLTQELEEKEGNLTSKKEELEKMLHQICNNEFSSGQKIRINHGMEMIERDIAKETELKRTLEVDLQLWEEKAKKLIALFAPHSPEEDSSTTTQTTPEEQREEAIQKTQKQRNRFPFSS